MLILPDGLVTFLFTDIEGSTKLWENHPEEMRAALNKHNEIIRTMVETNRGAVFKTVGDAFYSVFARAQDAVIAACQIQKAFSDEKWPAPTPLRVRIALNSGEAHPQDGDYFGPPMNLVARLLSLGRGGHVLLSRATQTLLEDKLPGEVALRDLGQHPLRDFANPVHVFCLIHPGISDEYPIHRSPRAVQNNLPLELSGFVGRKREQKEVQNLLSQSRLVTLTGSGGVGKTRLALKVAANVLESYPDGVWLVELSSLAHPDLVPRSLASVLGVREESNRPLADTLSEELHPKKLLLLIDNCEHVKEACAEIIEVLLRACPSLHILATSREPLGIEGEINWRVPCLALPDFHDLDPLEDLAQYEAMQLFIERARSVKASFELSQKNALAVAEICNTLDGIPLAIELAAARIKFLSVKQIAEKLNKQFEILTEGTRTTLPRHQTLRAAIDWGFDMISEAERATFRRLSVFVGGFQLESSVAICAGEGVQEDRFIDLLSGLVDKSFVLVNEGAEEEVRYRILGPLRQYGMEKLMKSGEEPWIMKRYKDYFLAFAEEAESKLNGAEQASWLNKLEQEHDNLRRTADLCTPLQGLYFTVALSKFWTVRGYFAEGTERLRSLLSNPETKAATQLRAKALYAAGNLAISQGDLSISRPLLEESYQIFQQIQDKKGCAIALRKIGGVAYRQGNLEEYKNFTEKSLALFLELKDEMGIAWCMLDLGNIASENSNEKLARSLYEKSLAICEKLGDKEFSPLLLCNIGIGHELAGNCQEARSYYEKYIAISRELGNKREIAFGLYHLGEVATRQGDYALARTSLEESSKILLYLKDKLYASYSLEGLAELNRKEGNLNHAVRLFAGAESLRKIIGAPLTSSDLAEHNQSIAELREALGDQAFEEGWKEGKKMDFETAIEYGLFGEKFRARRAEDIHQPAPS